MPGNQGSNKATTESAAQRQTIIARAAAVPVAAAAGPAPPPSAVPAAPAPPAGPLPAPPGPLLAPPGPLPPVAAPGGPRLPASGAPPGAAGGELAGAVCHQPPPAGLAAALGGPPMSVRIHIIRHEAHGPDPLHGGWIFTPATISATFVLGVHSLIGLTEAAAPYIPGGRHIRYIYGLNSAGQFIHMTMDFILVAIITGNPGPSMADFQLELGPLVGAGAPVGPVVPPIGPISGGGGAASRVSQSYGRSGVGSMEAGPSRGCYSSGPSRGGVGAGPSRGGYSTGPSRGGVGRGPSGSISGWWGKCLVSENYFLMKESSEAITKSLCILVRW